MGDFVFKEINPDDVLFKKEIYSIDNEEKCLKIYLPFAEKEITGAKFEDGYLYIK